MVNLPHSQFSDFSLTQPSQIMAFKNFAATSKENKELVRRIALKHVVEHFKGIDFSDPRNAADWDELEVWLAKLSLIGVLWKARETVALYVKLRGKTVMAIFGNQKLTIITLRGERHSKFMTKEEPEDVILEDLAKEGWRWANDEANESASSIVEAIMLLDEEGAY